MTRIESHAFGCSSLTSITVESGNSIYYSSDNCNAIIEKATNSLILGCRNTAIPNSVTSIKSCAFSGCSNLTSITVPNSEKNIEISAFDGSTSLLSDTPSEELYDYESDIFSDETYCKGTLYVPKGTKDLYTRSCGWWNFLNIKEKPSEVAGL